MPINYLRELLGTARHPRANRDLGWCLAFIAGAANAGGFLAVAEYTSHMTGIVSGVADYLALGELHMVWAGLLAVLSFLTGSMVCTWLIQWGRLHRRRSEFALPLMLEAILMLMFGVLGSKIQQAYFFYIPYAVLLLCFMMGLQNAMMTKISHAEIRTTHVTGVVTDIGIALGREVFWRQHAADTHEQQESRRRLALHSGLLGLFLMGGFLGALGFKHYGFQASIVLAVMLLLLAIVPLRDDWHLGSNARPQN
jgi:uncharacterized membrane protein YoaK (UPF0700 family)